LSDALWARDAKSLRTELEGAPRGCGSSVVLMAPEEIGVELTEGDMMDPEASVSALVFQHPDARYFGV
jgi:hypothetical protein